MIREPLSHSLLVMIFGGLLMLGIGVVAGVPRLAAFLYLCAVVIRLQLLR